MLISYIYRELNSLVKVKNLTKRNDFILFIFWFLKDVYIILNIR